MDKKPLKEPKKSEKQAKINKIEAVLGIKKKAEEVRVIIELSDERVDLVNFVESVLNFESEDDSK